MRILQVISLPATRERGGIGANGSEHSTTLLCRGLAARGHQVTLACGAAAPVAELARGAGVEVATLPTRQTRSLALAWSLIKLGKSKRAQIIVGHDLRACRVAQMAARVLRVPCVATMRGIYEVENYRDATRIVAVAEGVRQHLLDAGIAPAKVVTVHNGVDAAQFVPPADLAAAKVAVGVAPGALVVGVVARLSAEKGHDWFLQAAAPLVREFPDARFLIVGDGPLRADLEARARELGVGELARFVGYQAPVAPWMAAFDVLVLPSTAKEGLARSLIEAGALGKPCIASPVGGNGEAIVDGQTGLMVPTSDVAALSDAMRRLLRDEPLRQRLGNAARARVQADFSVEAMVEKTEAVYRELVRA